MVIINGVEKENYEEKTLREVLEAEEFDLKRIAVEKNGEIISKKLLNETIVRSGDCIEVVSFVGGG
jgi:sulfur carrier protein